MRSLADRSIVGQILGIPHAAVTSVIFGLLLASFPMGAFVVFATEIGDEINYDLPLTHLAFFKQTDLYLAPSTVTVGDAFVILWVFYLIIFTVASLGPERGFGRAVSDILAGRHLRARHGASNNYMLGAITWFSILVLCSIIIIVVQNSVGIQTIPPESGNLLTDFFYVTLAPILEEAGFRLLLVGFPVFLLYATKFSPRHVIKSLWCPAAHLDVSNDPKRAFAIIVVVGALFGFLHLAIGESWSEGKFAQATASGIILGWAYIKYGFVTSVIIHWAANYFVFAHVHFISQTHMIALEDAFSHPMIVSIEIILAVCGFLSILAMIVSYRRRHAQVV